MLLEILQILDFFFFFVIKQAYIIIIIWIHIYYVHVYLTIYQCNKHSAHPLNHNHTHHGFFTEQAPPHFVFPRVALVCSEWVSNPDLPRGSTHTL